MIIILKELRVFFNSHLDNSIKFLDDEKWYLHILVDKKMKKFHLISLYASKTSWNFNKKEKWFFEHWTLLSQTSFSLYFHNKWTDFHKPSCTEKPQMRAICTYVGCTKATTNDWDIRTLVAVKALSANISWTAEWICTIELVLWSVHQYVYNDIWCISKQ